jgi:hypothetical protein
MTTADRRCATAIPPEPVRPPAPPQAAQTGRADRVQLGPLGPTLASSQAAPTPDRAAHLAIQAIERQLERLVAGQRGEPSYGVPSRRRLGTTSAPTEAAQPESPPAAEES